MCICSYLLQVKITNFEKLSTYFLNLFKNPPLHPNYLTIKVRGLIFFTEQALKGWTITLLYLNSKCKIIIDGGGEQSPPSHLIYIRQKKPNRDMVNVLIVRLMVVKKIQFKTSNKYKIVLKYPFFPWLSFHGSRCGVFFFCGESQIFFAIYHNDIFWQYILSINITCANLLHCFVIKIYCHVIVQICLANQNLK